MIVALTFFLKLQATRRTSSPQPVTELLHNTRILLTNRLRDDRDWLTVLEAVELARLLDAYWTTMGALPTQVNLAISLSEAVVHQPTRATALACMRRALSEFLVEGIKTTIPLHREIFNHSSFIEGQVDTTFIERNWQKG